MKVLDIMQSYTGYSRRHLCRYLTPPGGFGKRKLRPSFLLIRKWEELANLLEPGKSLLTTKRVLLSKRGAYTIARSPMKLAARSVA